MEPITVTRDEIIYQRRVRVLDHATETGNVSATCRCWHRLVGEAAAARW